MTHLTELEQQLLAALRKNGRATVSALAQELGVTRSTVTSTMTRLENSGVIQGYTVMVNHGPEALSMRAVAMLEVDNHSTQAAIAQLRRLPEVEEIHTTNGIWDLVVLLRCQTLGDFDRVLQLISAMKGIVNSQTSILLTHVGP